MPPPHQENLRVLAIILIIFWLTTSSGDGQAGYFSTPFLAQERLARQREALSVLNSTHWGDFNPRQSSDPPNGTEHTQDVNITGFRTGDGFAWEDLGPFREQCLETSRATVSRLPPGPFLKENPLLRRNEGESPRRPAWDIGLGEPTWLNATGLVKGPWVRARRSVSRTSLDYNLTALTPTINWSGTHGEWNRNLTGSEGMMQLRIEDKKCHLLYEEELGDDEHPRLSTGGSVREVAAGLTIEDSGHDGSGSLFEMRLHGVHWPRQGNMLLTTTSEKFAGIFGLPHLAPEENYFLSSQQLLTQTIDEALRKKENSAITDQRNPWTSSVGGAEDAWSPSPHCEYVVYLQVHPLGMESLPHPEDGFLDAVKVVEDELRNPTGAPLPRVPELRMSAVIYSPDCAFSLASKGPPHFPEAEGVHLVGFKEEIWIYDVNLFVLVMAAIVFAQVHLLKIQMRESCTPSTLGRISFWTINMMVLADGMMFTVSAVLSLDSTNFFLRALILSFALFMSMMIGGSFLGEIYTIQETEWRPREREQAAHSSSSSSSSSTSMSSSTPVPPRGVSLPLPVTVTDVPLITPSDQDVDAEIAEITAAGAAAVRTTGTTLAGTQQPRVTPFSIIIGRLMLAGSFLCFLSLAAMSWWKPLRNLFVNTVLLAYLSFWVPQIVRNTQRNSRRAFSWQFMIGQSVLRPLPIAYFYLHRNNMIFAETDWVAFSVLAGWLWVQLWALAFQDVLGPRFGMPKGWMPEAWDYHPILREDNVEGGGLPIGLAASNSNPGSPSLNRVRSLSLGSGQADGGVWERSSYAAKGGAKAMRTRAIECAICQEAVDVPVVRAGEGAEPTGGGVAAVLERRKYMVTPCRHIFHSACLEGWLRFRLQCPICREELPPL